MGSSALEAIFRRERLIVRGSLVVTVIIAWLYLLYMNRGVPSMKMTGMDMPGMVMPELHQWSAASVLFLIVMWAVMMMAMMLPSAAPMILTFLSLNQRRRVAARPLVPASIFLLGYIVVWTGYSIVAALAQWRLHEAALLSSTMKATSPLVSGGLLIAAGVFQWTPFKRACLKSCRSPLSFLMSDWREGAAGAFIMGLRHGTYCVGCCWILMALLFVAGVMNLLWVAVISLFVMAEKVLARGPLFSHAAGISLVTAGVAVMARLW